MADTVITWEDDNYVGAKTIEPGKGYWLFVPTSSAAFIEGEPITQFTQHFTPGWHLLGSVLDSVDFADPNDTPEGAILHPAFGWNTGEARYFSSPAIEPGFGHWIAAAQECDLTVAGGSGTSVTQATRQYATPQSLRRRLGTGSPAPPRPSNFSQSSEYTRVESRHSFTNPNFIASRHLRQIVNKLTEDSSWTVPIQVEIGSVVFSLNLGVQSDATDGYDVALDTLTPPPPRTAYVALTIPEFPNTLQADYRGPESRITWRIEAFNVNSDTIRFSWTLSEAPQEGMLFLNSAIDMLTNTNAAFVDEQVFEIVYSLPVSVESSPTPLVPQEFRITNYPNPFTETTTLEIALPTSSPIALRIYNSLGQEIRRIDRPRFASGHYSFEWDGKDQNGYKVPSGLYFWVIEAFGHVVAKKLHLVR